MEENSSEGQTDEEEVHTEEELIVEKSQCPLPFLHYQVSSIISEASKNILVETTSFYEDMILKKQIAIDEERERNSKIILALEKQLNLKEITTIQHKYLSKWKMFIVEQKNERLLMNIAAQFYQERLVRKMFAHWLNFVRTNWKKRMELKIVMEVYENQRAIVESYEAKIRSLTQNKSELNEHLNSLHKSFENSLHVAFMQGVNHATDKQTIPQSKTSDSNTEIISSEPMPENINLTDFCGSTFVFSDMPSVSYKDTKEIIQKTPSKKHPSSLPKRLPIGGTLTYVKSGMPVMPLRSDSTFVVERHIPITEPNTSVLSKTTTSLSRSQKKFV